MKVFVVEDGRKTRDLLAAFLDDLRNSKPCHTVKAMIIGKKVCLLVWCLIGFNLIPFKH